MKKIIAECRQVADSVINVQLLDKDGNPIVFTPDEDSLITTPYALSCECSTMEWVKMDVNKFTAELDYLFPLGWEFEFKHIEERSCMLPFRFTKELIQELGMVWEEYVSPYPNTPKDKYGRAKTPNGKRLLGWHHDYYSEGIHHLTIHEDAGTRQVFHGRISKFGHLKLILELID